jgi:hypothetical protein
MSGTDPVRGYLLDTVTQERFDFQFNPAEISVKLGASWTEKTPRGASHARQQFAHGKGRAFELSLYFLRTTVDASDMLAKQHAIEALSFPDYDTSGRLAGGPHPVRVAFGTWRTLRCIVGTVEIGYGPYFDNVTLTPGEFTAKIEFVEVPEGGDIGFEDVRRGNF